MKGETLWEIVNARKNATGIFAVLCVRKDMSVQMFAELVSRQRKLQTISSR